jgi:hypothetical protein
MARSFNVDRAAAALVRALFSGDPVACREFGITPRTLRNYRGRLESGRPEDQKLVLAFRQLKDRYHREWAEDLGSTIRAQLSFLKEAAVKAQSEPNALKNPTYIQATTEALKGCADIEMTLKMLDPFKPKSDDDEMSQALANKSVSTPFVS